MTRTYQILFVVLWLTLLLVVGWYQWGNRDVVIGNTGAQCAPNAIGARDFHPAIGAKELQPAFPPQPNPATVGGC